MSGAESGAGGVALTIAGPCFAELRGFWEAGELCDVALRAGGAADAPLLPAHKLVLAAVSSYFHGLFAGAGRHMQHCSRPGSGGSGGGLGGGAGGASTGRSRDATQSGGGGGGGDGGQASGVDGECPMLPVVDLPALEPQQLRSVIAAVYMQRLHVSVDNVQSLLACSDFLGVSSVTDACSQASSASWRSCSTYASDHPYRWHDGTTAVVSACDATASDACS